MEFACPDSHSGAAGGGGGGGGRFSPLLDAKEKEPRRGLSDPNEGGGGSSRHRDRESENGGSEGGPRSQLREGEMAEAKTDQNNGRHGRLPGTK